MLLQTDEDVDAQSNWTGFQGLQSEVRYGITSDDIFLFVQGEDNLCGILKVLDWGVSGDEMVPDEEHELQ